MKQLTKADIKKLPAGKWRGYVKLFKIHDLKPPEPHMAREWIVEIDDINGQRFLTVNSLTWPQYHVGDDCTSTGDLVYDMKLMQLYK